MSLICSIFLRFLLSVFPALSVFPSFCLSRAGGNPSSLFFSFRHSTHIACWIPEPATADFQQVRDDKLESRWQRLNIFHPLLKMQFFCRSGSLAVLTSLGIVYLRPCSGSDAGSGHTLYFPSASFFLRALYLLRYSTSLLSRPTSLGL